MTELVLSPNEARVVAALVEKSVATPQYYPMTVNALMMASNQKNSRSPIMALSEGDVGAALTQLEAGRLVQRDDLAGRVPKWRHRFQHQLLLKPPTLAVLATLMLRGAQTPAELRANAQGLGGPPDVEGITAALADLSDRARPFVVQLPRAAGQAAARYAHLLCGTPAVTAEPPPRAARVHESESAAALAMRVRELEERVAELERRLAET